MTGSFPPPEIAGSRPSQRGLFAAIACIAMFGVAQSMTNPLFALLLERRAYPSILIGLNAAMPAVATLTLAPFMPRVIQSIGLPAFLTLGAAFSAFTLLMFPLFDDYLSWTVLRYLQGGAATVLFVGAEVWIVAAADIKMRGRIVGLYATTLSLGFASGPMMLIGIGYEGWSPFIATAAGSLLCIAPLATAWRDAPHAEEEETTVSPFRFFRTDPTMMFAVVLFGAIEFGVMALISVWGLRTGLDWRSATFLLAILTLGNVVFQIPIGAAADKFDRHKILIGCALASLIAATLLPVFAGTRWPLWSVLFIWGGLVAGLYTVPLIELGARYAGTTLVSANTGAVIGYGFGALLAPPLIGAAMDVTGSHGLSISLGTMAMAFLILAFARMRAPRKREDPGRENS